MDDADLIAIISAVPQPLISLFANGENGVLFYPTIDKSIQKLTNNGTGGSVATSGDAEGLYLDTHAWGPGGTISTALQSQTNLLIAGSWTMSVAGGTSTATESPPGTLNLQSDGTNSARGDQSFATVVGQTYVIYGTPTTNNAINCLVGTTQGGTQVMTQQAVFANRPIFFVATATTTWVRFIRSAAGSFSISNISCQYLPGNHAVQATSGSRPLWTTLNRSAYLAFDGTDDYLLSPFIPTAALTIAVACNPTSAATTVVPVGGGATTGNKRGFVGFAASTGFACGAFGDVTTSTLVGAVDCRGQNVVLVMTGDATGVQLYVNGLMVSSAAPTATPDGTGGGLALGGYNNAGVMGATNYFPGKVYASLAVNRRCTQSEVAAITYNMQKVF